MIQAALYKKKIIILSSLIAVLAATYTLSFVFDPERRQGSTFAWLPAHLHILVDRIEISGALGSSVLVRRNDVWFLLADGREYPVRQQRVADMLAALSRREMFTLRSTSAAARENFGLSPESASRILVRGGIGLPLLDLFIGISDALGMEVYMAEANEREIFSGADRLAIFADSGPRFWLDFRLFAGGTHAAQGIPGSMVQQAEVAFDGVSYILRREGSGWIILPTIDDEPITPRVEAWLRSVLDAEGETFAAADFFAAGTVFVETENFAADETVYERSITLSFGDGTSRVMRVSHLLDEENRRLAAVTHSPHVYVLSEWTVNRLFVESEHFIR
jgi:hypothetical protein